MIKKFKCPRCGKETEDHPALSRRDAKTEICSACGVEEAMFDYQMMLFKKKESGWMKKT